MDDSAGLDTVMAILEERARALARPAEASEPVEALSLVVLAVGGERYGVEIRHVREVHSVSPPTPVPGTPPFWIGLVNARGGLYPLLDLRRYLGLPEREGPGRMVLVAGAGLVVGLMVDDVPEVRDVPLSDIRPPLGAVPGPMQRVVRGVTPDLLSVIDLEALLADPQLVMDDEPV
jgi:purine-binding chemotaxis protein CheW